MRYTLYPGLGLRLNVRRVGGGIQDRVGGRRTWRLRYEPLECIMLEYVKSTTQIIIGVRELPNEARKFDLYTRPGPNRFEALVHV